MSRAVLVSASLLLAFAVSVTACTAEEVSGEGDQSSASSTAAPDVDLPVLTEESPSGGSAFTFCAKPSASAPLNLTNAAWLAMFSANEYGHLRHLAPQLRDLRFGNDTDEFWRLCGEDMGRMRRFEADPERAAELARAKRQGPDALVRYMQRATAPTSSVHQADLDVGVCARSFFADPDNGGRYTGRDVDGEIVMPAQALRDWLVRTTDPTNGIQFFSARPTSFIERALGKGSTQAFVAKHEDKKIVVVSFRGTQIPDAQSQAGAIADILRDLTFWRTDTARFGFSPGWGRTHTGFMEALESADDGDRGQILTEKVRGLVGGDPDVGVWVTGHSLGGALATLFTARLLDLQERGEHFNVRGMYTFGAPRVGDEAFKNKMEAMATKHGVALVRFRNDSDLVTSVPFDLMGYDHVGTRALLQGGALTILDEDPARGRSAADHAISGIVALAGRRQATNGYYAHVKQLLHRNTDTALVACDDAP